ncbi:MAG TPA: SGNH/GDSL hydrolase family protein [Candidatus Paceibacterota bacterium]|nr:SGNH/GDSL hydrolase family protein [Verrucomicrobiota bacterium]HSA10989.1 SGNH/GDSL hydrolase family protein [Candidatus Paceibacterota bacterium]
MRIRCQKNAAVMALGCLLVQANAQGQAADQAGGLRWHDARTLTVEGKGWSDTKQFYDRLPARAEGIVRGAVWGLSQDSAGIAVRFVTDAAAISARWTLRRERLAMAHMPASGVSGVDLYVKERGKWRWLGGGRAERFPTEEKELVKSMKPARREYLLNLPLYNGVESVMVGVPLDAKLEPAARRPEGQGPILFYGTSIVQGGCASRPGMAHPAILGRRLDRAHINLGFSGNAWSEPEMAQLLAELDPAVYVLDPLPNMKEEWVVPRLERFVAILRGAHPKTPIVLVENIAYPDGDYVGPRGERYMKANGRLRELHRRLVRAGDQRLLYVPAAGLLGTDTEGTVDGTHPTDLGFMRMADALEPTLQRALKLRH